MDEEQLKALLGENYDGAKDFFKDQILNTGEYVNKGKSDAEHRELQKQLDAAKAKIKENMSAEDKVKAEAQAKDDMIAQLQRELSENKIDANKSKAIGAVAEMTTLLGLKSDDKELVGFVENISSEDSERTLSISNFVNKIAKEAYEKGKAEATKQNLGKIGGFNANGGTNSSKAGETEGIAARLAKQFNTKPVESDYFKN